MSSRRAVPSLRKRVGKTLRARRLGRGWSQEVLGQKARLSGKFIGEVERGEKSISLDSLAQIAGAFSAKIVEFVR